jgi:hypothetical protein
MIKLKTNKKGIKNNLNQLGYFVKLWSRDRDNFIEKNKKK